MKKWWIAAVLAAVCCVSGCGSKGGNSEESTPNGGVESTPDVGEELGLTRISTPYSAEDLSALTFTDIANSLTVDMTGNSHLKGLMTDMKYYLPEDGAPTDVADARYTLSLSGMEIKIGFGGDNGNVCFVFADGSTQLSVVAQDEFSYLDTLLSSGVVTIDGYTPAYNIRVYDTEDVGGAVKDKATFLESLQGVRFVKLNNLSHYGLGQKTHTVKLGKDEMSVYSKYVVYKGELYAIYQGNFEFLKNVEFSDSTELPWVHEAVV